ncbi:MULTISPECIES: DUF3073 domain-containing protein [Lentzea]|jgi:hypothetical protein|uniref:DUF3073 domain-containing protein n=5 Tax=Lentzea TaxID=165301 RepID=A0A1W2EB44_9PSEU|nr:MULTISPECIES: DUF3073 domain-containing protein [Lentzea]MCX2948179.1 DUF3073 domain-containing protein [Lentzea sp. NEAU-D7]MDX8049091.1 DUF3073 domain-containing protein [Lentzea sp. BCCO 10_0798]MDX8144465.1 DUF3073 domain-containing protein [Lentzea sp. BCCO 10_0061]RDI29845.1 DUF3073 family protein [Lentzea flaviverrucosa]SER47606.1 Protein of unknown function [Lentzea flaviverrucosa]
MGRGRAKAKQTKVARELKYSSHETDFAALQRELSTDERSPNGSSGGDEPHDDPYDDYDDYRR